MSGDMRQTRNTPAVTIVAAWINADRFPHRTDEQQECDHIRRVPISPKERQGHFGQLRRHRKDVVKLDAVGQEEQRKDTKGKAKITNTVDHKGFDGRGVRAWLFIVKADQQV